MSFNQHLIKPTAVSSDLVVQELGTELLVYNLSNHKVMSLNSTLSVIWQLCDGKRNLSDLKKLTEIQLQEFISEEVIFLAIDELKRNNLITLNDLHQPAELSQMNRRRMIKNIGLTTAIAIPLITGLVAPKAVSAASGNTCTQDSDCQSLCCVNNECTQFNQGEQPINAVCFVDADCQSNCCDTGICAPACGVCFI